MLQSLSFNRHDRRRPDGSGEKAGDDIGRAIVADIDSRHAYQEDEAAGKDPDPDLRSRVSRPREQSVSYSSGG